MEGREHFDISGWNVFSPCGKRCFTVTFSILGMQIRLLKDSLVDICPRGMI